MEETYLILTGEKGLDQFDVEMKIAACSDIEDLQNQYRQCRNELFYMKKKYNKLTNNWFFKILTKLKII
jgi:hypothetical protein